VVLSFQLFGVGDHPDPIRNQRIIGKDELPVGATLSFQDDKLVCRKESQDAVALELQYDAGVLGMLNLRTCLLPPRDKPYLLTLELARHRIMLFLNKLESWALSGLSADTEVMKLFERAREAFTRSLVGHGPGPGNGEFTREQSEAAHESLMLSIEASEQLAVLNAERMLLRKFDPPKDKQGNVIADKLELDPVLAGCTVDTAQFAPPLQKIVAKHFDFVSCPLRWSDLEAKEGAYTFGQTDRWIEWAVRNAKMPVVAGPLLDFSRGTVPEWLYVWEHDYSTLREIAYEHMRRVITRYRRTVTRWTVCSGVNINDRFKLKIQEMLDLTRLAVLLVRKLHPTAEVVVEIDQPWGEHVSRNSKSLHPMLFADMLNEAGLGIDAYGLRIQMGEPREGRATRDLMMLSDLIDQFAVFGKPLHITALGAPSEALQPNEDIANRASVGRWHEEEWNGQTQADWLTGALTIALAKPHVKSVCWQSLYDQHIDIAEMPSGGLISAEGRAKPSLKRVGELLAAFHQDKLPRKLIEGAAMYKAASSA